MPFDVPHNPVTVSRDDLIALKERARHVKTPQTRQSATKGSGDTRSFFRSRGLDFQEMRAYQPGDDIRQINWRMTAKYGKPFTKLYTEEKQRPVYLICDMRSRMKFASHGDFKSVVAARLTLFLGWLAEQKKDKIRTILILPNLIKTRVLENGENGLLHFISDIEAASVPTQTEPDETSLTQALTEIGRTSESGAFIFICSDCHDLTTAAVKELVHIGRKSDIALIQIYDNMEKHLPTGIFPITNGTDKIVVDTTQKDLQQTMTHSFQQQSDFIRENAARHGWGYLPVRTNDDYLALIASFCLGGQN
jgi:uncharacterized protein (DUF58 family)